MSVDAASHNGPELPALVLQCRLVCRQWRSAFAGSIDRLYLQVALDPEVTDRHVAAAAAAFPAATRATLLLPNCAYARCNPYDSCGGVSAARTALGRRSNATNEARRRALLHPAGGVAAGAGGGAASASAAAAGQELGGAQDRVNGQESGDADDASSAEHSEGSEEGDEEPGAEGGQHARPDAQADAGATAAAAAADGSAAVPVPRRPPPLPPLEVGRLACEAALVSVRRHLPALVGLRLGHAERPPPRLGPRAALAQSLLHPQLAAAAASACASAGSLSCPQPSQPPDTSAAGGAGTGPPAAQLHYPGYRLDSAAHATLAALAASHWTYPASLVPGEGAAAWPQPQHTVSQHAAEQAVAAAHRSALDLTPLLLPSQSQGEAGATAAAVGGDVFGGAVRAGDVEAIAGTSGNFQQAKPSGLSGPLPQLTSLAELDLRCAAAVGALAPLSSLCGSSGGESHNGTGSSNNAAFGNPSTPDAQQQQHQQQQQQLLQLPLPALTALTVLQLREGGQLPAIRALGGRLRALDLWCNEGSSLADLAYWTSAAPQRIRRGLPLLASGLTGLTRLVLRELAAQVEPPAALTCLCSLPLLAALTAEVLYVDPWRQLAELTEQLAGDEEDEEESKEEDEEEEEEEEESGQESDEESEEGSQSDSESGGDGSDEGEHDGSEDAEGEDDDLVAPAARARQGSSRLPPAARARELEFSFSRGPQLAASGASAGGGGRCGGGGVNGAAFADAVAATAAAAMREVAVAAGAAAAAAAAAAAGSVTTPASAAGGGAADAPKAAAAKPAQASPAAAAAATELAALAVALGPGRAEHIRAVLERGSGALQEMAPLDLFSCFAGGSSVGAAGGSSRVGLRELDITFVGCGLLPGCWAGVAALGGSLRRLALRVGRSAEEERLVARLQQRLAPGAASAWLPDAFRVANLAALPHLTHLQLDAPLCPRLAARLLRLAPPPPPATAAPESAPEQPQAVQHLTALQLYGLYDVEASLQRQPQRQQGTGHKFDVDECTGLATPLGPAPATAMLRTLHLDGDLSAVAAALAGGALVGAASDGGCSSPAGLLLPRLAELRLAHRPAGRPAAAAAWLLLPWGALPPSLEQLHLEGVDMRLLRPTDGTTSSGGVNEAGQGQCGAGSLPRLQRLHLRHCAAELAPLRGCPLEDVAVTAAWLLLPGCAAAENGAAGTVAAARAVAAAPWDVAAQLVAVRSQPWTPRLQSLSLQLCAAPGHVTPRSPVPAEPAPATATPATVMPAAPVATAAMPRLERLSVTWELAALVDPEPLSYSAPGAMPGSTRPPAGPRELCGPRPVGLTPGAARALLEGLLPLGAVGTGAGAAASAAGAAAGPGGMTGLGCGPTPAIRSLELYVGDVSGGGDGGGDGGALSVEGLLWLARLRSLRRLRLVLCVSESGGQGDAVTAAVNSSAASEAAAMAASAGGSDAVTEPAAPGVSAAAAAGPTSAWLHAELSELLLSALPYCQTQVVQVRVP
ncbi:hypothetical protein HXX76_010002 [Chlamydomonas incerta]|uniref:Uncharacterized protein n=1 Tax=Chlamydomonas incerta TaxID=51695 RepID=A0A835SNV8_CHLIN|nr:hypothetical protein HXX76_010002 [Chlamydomonas incerta]|eukprot:KAG2430479.1 hypothetical protein HXX76_010002 [Chlamydomonas incerta]